MVALVRVGRPVATCGLSAVRILAAPRDVATMEMAALGLLVA
jgi:hypothetical protein